MSEKVSDRLPPYSLEGEMGVLGCCLLDPKLVVPQCMERMKDPDRVFYNPSHQSIYASLCSLYEADKLGLAEISPDRVEWIFLLSEELRGNGTYDAVGGSAYLEELMDFSPHVSNVDAYLEVVLKKAVLRSVVRGCAEISRWVQENEKLDYQDVLDRVETDLLGICQDSIVKEKSRAINDIVHDAITEIEEAAEHEGQIGVRTGFKDFDKITGGLRGGQMVVIAARPSVGKTSLAMGIAENVAVGNGIPVGVFSLEMTDTELVKRSMSSLARVDSLSIRDGKCLERDYPKLIAAAAKLRAAPLYIDDSPGLSLQQLRGKARRMVVEKGVKLIVIDYLQLLHCLGRRYENNRQQEVADISSGIKALTKELSVPIIVLCQLNRDVEREKRKPKLSDLRESGAIEQDADLIAFLYRPDESEPTYEQESVAQSINLLVAKQRNGPTGEVRFTFLRCFTRYESRSEISPNDIPNQESFDAL